MVYPIVYSLLTIIRVGLYKYLVEQNNSYDLFECITGILVIVFQFQKPSQDIINKILVSVYLLL